MALDLIKSLKNFWSNSAHILSVSYKPDTPTFVRTIKIVLLGTLVLGILGFIISLVITFITA
jgi:protein translocase SEC61 complex gamma subunit